LRADVGPFCAPITKKDRLAESDRVFARIQKQKSNGSPAKTTANKMLTSSSEINEIGHELDTPGGNGERAAS